MNVRHARLSLLVFPLPDLIPSTFSSRCLRLHSRFTNMSRSGQWGGPDGTAHMQFALWPGRLMNPFGD